MKKKLKKKAARPKDWEHRIAEELRKIEAQIEALGLMDVEIHARANRGLHTSEFHLRGNDLSISMTSGVGHGWGGLEECPPYPTYPFGLPARDEGKEE